MTTPPQFDVSLDIFHDVSRIGLIYRPECFGGSFYVQRESHVGILPTDELDIFIEHAQRASALFTPAGRDALFFHDFSKMGSLEELIVALSSRRLMGPALLRSILNQQNQRLLEMWRARYGFNSFAALSHMFDVNPKHKNAAKAASGPYIYTVSRVDGHEQLWAERFIPVSSLNFGKESVGLPPILVLDCTPVLDGNQIELTFGDGLTGTGIKPGV